MAMRELLLRMGKARLHWVVGLHFEISEGVHHDVGLIWVVHEGFAGIFVGHCSMLRHIDVQATFYSITSVSSGKSNCWEPDLKPSSLSMAFALAMAIAASSSRHNCSILAFSF